MASSSSPPPPLQIVVDFRETALHEALRTLLLNSRTFPGLFFQTESLLLGDICIRDQAKDMVIIERKTIADLLASIKDKRYDEQSHRLCHSSELPRHHIIYLIEGSMKSVSEAEQTIAYGAMVSLHFKKGFSVIRTNTVAESAMFILHMQRKLQRIQQTPAEILFHHGETPSAAPEDTTAKKSFVKKRKMDNVTVKSFAISVLELIPHVSVTIATALMEPFDSLQSCLEHWQANPTSLQTIKINQRKIPCCAVESIQQYLLQKP
jgi:ERCC4-type nuclease